MSATLRGAVPARDGLSGASAGGGFADNFAPHEQHSSPDFVRSTQACTPLARFWGAIAIQRRTSRPHGVAAKGALVKDAEG